MACVIVASRQSSSNCDRQNGLPDCRCVLIQIVALQALLRVANRDTRRGKAGRFGEPMKFKHVSDKRIS
jgi:hypothetical protein